MITESDATDQEGEEPAVRATWFCAGCRTRVVTKIVDDVPVCSECGAPIERFLE